MRNFPLSAVSGGVAWVPAAAALAVTLATVPRIVPAQCVGDCNRDGQVTVNELIQMVNIALGTVAVSVCTAGDPNGDGEITVNEIVAGVNFALAGFCEEGGCAHTSCIRPASMNRTPAMTIGEIRTTDMSIHTPISQPNRTPQTTTPAAPANRSTAARRSSRP